MFGRAIDAGALFLLATETEEAGSAGHDRKTFSLMFIFNFIFIFLEGYGGAELIVRSNSKDRHQPRCNYAPRRCLPRGAKSTRGESVLLAGKHV